MMPSLSPALIATVFLPYFVNGLDNGVGLVPQMGWSSWNHFGPNINENLTLEIADAMVSSGMAHVGYEYVNLDDAWMSMHRLANTSITWDPDKFPSGMPAISAKLHTQHLKFGLYSARCRRTCEDFPGSFGHEVRDAASIASWNVDYLKFDNCRDCPPTTSAVVQFAQMATALNATGRRIFYSNELVPSEASSLYPTAWQFSNSARVGGDISPSWSHIVGMIDTTEPLAPWAGPGFWNDCDMLEVGNGMSEVEDRSHFALWCILASPLIAGNDLRHMSDTTRSILTNPGAISVNQDPLGVQAIVCSKTKEVQVWAKPMADGSTVLLLLNRADNTTHDITAPFSACIMHGSPDSSVSVVDVWNSTLLGTNNNQFTAKSVPPHGSVFVRLKPAVTSGPGVRHCAETQPPCSLITSGREHHMCAALDRLITPVRLHCPVGTTIGNVHAHWGIPTGSCSTGYAAKDGCSTNSTAVSLAVAQHCVGREQCQIRSEQFVSLLGRPSGEVCDHIAALAEESANDCPAHRASGVFARFVASYECLPDLQIRSMKNDDDQGTPVSGVWARGSFARLVVEVRSDRLNYSINVGSERWLVSTIKNDAVAYCDGAWVAATDYTARQINSSNEIGEFHSLRVSSTAARRQLVQEFRYYPQADCFQFFTMFPHGCDNTRLPDSQNPAMDEYNASSLPLSTFPKFDASNGTMLGSKLGWFSWQGRFSLDGTVKGHKGLQNLGVRVANGAAPHGDEYVGGSTGGPLLLFHPSDPRSVVLALSPADNFLDGIIGLDRQQETLQFGLQGKLKAVPPGTNVSFFVSPSSSGINMAMQKLGELLWTLHNTTRPGAPCRKVGDAHSGCPPANTITDMVTQGLGYWTDNGAFFSCKNPPNETTLEALAGSLKAANVPIRYMQMDPWWFAQDPGSPCGDAFSFSPRAELFSGTINQLSEAIGMPLLLYTAFWSASEIPKRYPMYDFINSTAITGPDSHFCDHVTANVAPKDSERFYSDIFAQQCGTNGSVCSGYEVDFLDSNLLCYDEFTSTFGAAAKWQDGWGAAGAKSRMSGQICMDLPSAALQSLASPWITSARASEDNFPRGGFLSHNGRWRTPYTNILYSALHLAPFYDVVWSSAVEPHNAYNLSRLNIELQYLLSSLGNGVLGIGDGPGDVNRTLVMQGVQADGTLRKALKPLTPIDLMFGDPKTTGIPHGAEIFCTTSSFAIDTGGRTDPGTIDWQWWHVVGVNISHGAFLLGPDDLSPPLTPHVSYVAYNYFNSGGCADGAPAAGCVSAFGHGHPPLRLSTTAPSADELGFSLWRVAAVCVGFSTDGSASGGGFALLGERDKYLAVAPQRVKRMQCTESEFFVQWYGSTDDEVVDMMVLDARKGINNGTIVSMKSMTGAKGLASMRCTSQHGCNMVE